MSFLTAEWNNIALINYEIDATLLHSYVPKGTELDFFNGKCYVSIVGFMFENVRVRGIKIPFHVNFEEVNLRFYVRRLENGIWRRGAVFISEIVPKLAISYVANTFYKEHYSTLPMRHTITNNGTTQRFIYEWKLASTWNSIELNTTNQPINIPAQSEAEFITEHYYGYTQQSKNVLYEYEVKHPRWQQYEVLSTQINIDFKTVYGSTFGFLKTQQPTSVLLAKGSKISIENKRKIVV